MSYEWVPPGRTARRQESEGQRLWQSQHPRWPSRATVLRHFGSWGEALEAAGLPARRLILELPFEERVFAARELARQGLGIREIAGRLGVQPATARSYLRAETCRGCGAPIVQSATGLCRRCSQVRSSWTKEEVIAALRGWATEQGQPPTYAEWGPDNERWRREFPRWPSAAIVHWLFGSWNRALAAAGCRPRSRAWSAEEIVAAFRNWASEHDGHPPAYTDWRLATRDHPGVTVVADRFGSWTKGVLAAGFDPRHRRWEREEVIAALRAWSQAHGRSPSSREATRGDGLPSYRVVARLFGSWPAAIEAAGLKQRESTSE